MRLFFTILSFVLLGTGSTAARTGDGSPTTVGQQFQAVSPGCGGASVCLGLKLHVVVRDNQPIQSPAWFANQLAETNRHFAHLGVGFQLTGVERLTTRHAVVSTAKQRDWLGRRVVRRGELHVFLIGHLVDIDEPGERYGVHWRDRYYKRRHWVVLARDAPTWVLAHEIGHFFGLRHSNYADSIMNKRPRTHPPEAERSFARREFVQIKRKLRRMLQTRELHTRQ